MFTIPPDTALITTPIVPSEKLVPIPIAEPAVVVNRQRGVTAITDPLIIVEPIVTVLRGLDRLVNGLTDAVIVAEQQAGINRERGVSLEFFVGPFL